MIAGAGGAAVNQIVLTGIGGNGTGGNHFGVRLASGSSFVVDGTNNQNSLTFLNCSGGMGGNANRGISIESNISLSNGSIIFNNVSGGGDSASSSNYGIFITGTSTQVNAPVILMTDVYGGPGNSNNYGLYILSGRTLGSSSTNQIHVSAGSLGTVNSNHGIYLDGRILVGDGGEINIP